MKFLIGIWALPFSFLVGLFIVVRNWSEFIELVRMQEIQEIQDRFTKQAPSDMGFYILGTITNILIYLYFIR